MNDIWTTGIMVDKLDEGWIASCDWRCGKLNVAGYMEGKIFTRYQEPTLFQAIDYVLSMMNRMGVKRCDLMENVDKNFGFDLYHDVNKEYSNEVLNEIKQEAVRRGWKCYVD